VYRLPFLRQHPDQADCDMFSTASSAVQDKFDEILSGTEVSHEIMSSDADRAKWDVSVSECESTAARHIESDIVNRAQVTVDSLKSLAVTNHAERDASAHRIEVEGINCVKASIDSLTKADGDLEGETMTVCHTGHVKMDIISTIQAAVNLLVVVDNAEHNFDGDCENTASRNTGDNEMDSDNIKSSVDSFAFAGHNTESDSCGICHNEQVESNCDVLSSFNDSSMTAVIGQDQNGNGSLAIDEISLTVDGQCESDDSVGGNQSTNHTQQGETASMMNGLASDWPVKVDRVDRSLNSQNLTALQPKDDEKGCNNNPSPFNNLAVIVPAAHCEKRSVHSETVIDISGTPAAVGMVEDHLSYSHLHESNKADCNLMRTYATIDVISVPASVNLDKNICEYAAAYDVIPATDNVVESEIPDAQTVSSNTAIDKRNVDGETSAECDPVSAGPSESGEKGIETACVHRDFTLPLVADRNCGTKLKAAGKKRKASNSRQTVEKHCAISTTINVAATTACMGTPPSSVKVQNGCEQAGANDATRATDNEVESEIPDAQTVSKITAIDKRNVDVSRTRSSFGRSVWMWRKRN
jgi:hypothetical protein